MTSFSLEATEGRMRPSVLRGAPIVVPALSMHITPDPDPGRDPAPQPTPGPSPLTDPPPTEIPQPMEIPPLTPSPMTDPPVMPPMA
jgi:hypothetical protein